MGITTDKIMRLFAYRTGHEVYRVYCNNYYLRKNDDISTFYFDPVYGFFVNGEKHKEYETIFMKALKDLEREYFG
jgi:hypothetical protein